MVKVIIICLLESIFLHLWPIEYEDCLQFWQKYLLMWDLCAAIFSRPRCILNSYCLVPSKVNIWYLAKQGNHWVLLSRGWQWRRWREVGKLFRPANICWQACSQFHRHFMSSFYKLRSQNWQKDSQTISFFLRFWDLGTWKLLVKQWWNWHLQCRIEVPRGINMAARAQSTMAWWKRRPWLHLQEKKVLFWIIDGCSLSPAFSESGEEEVWKSERHTNTQSVDKKNISCSLSHYLALYTICNDQTTCLSFIICSHFISDLMYIWLKVGLFSGT